MTEQDFKEVMVASNKPTWCSYGYINLQIIHWIPIFFFF